tara:strand:- start:946 stop:1092 length:147 start_codon:yes stop_codon:yes gene_type:complete
MEYITNKLLELLQIISFSLLVSVLVGIMLMQAAALVWMFWDMFIRKDM